MKRMIEDPLENELPVSGFLEAIQATHGAKARHVWRERVEERFEGETVWDGDVLVFELDDHPTASLCYAWSVDGEVTAVLHEPPIVDCALAAVRAAIMADGAGDADRG